MKIKFLFDGLYEVTNSYDEKNDVANTSDETFRKDEIHDVDLVDDRGDNVNIQFGDGSVLYGLPKANFETLESE